MTRFLTFLALILVPGNALALQQRSVVLTTGIRITYTQAMNNLISYLAASASAVAICIFLLGAFYVVASGGNTDRVGTGKNLMKNALIGLGVILGSYAILRTVFYLLY